MKFTKKCLVFTQEREIGLAGLPLGLHELLLEVLCEAGLRYPRRLAFPLSGLLQTPFLRLGPGVSARLEGVQSSSFLSGT